jgi:hypothetical protein
MAQYDPSEVISPHKAEKSIDGKSLDAAVTEEPWWQTLGLGLITGAAEDDPSGIATYSQAVAQFGYTGGMDRSVDLSIDGRDPGAWRSQSM